MKQSTAVLLALLFSSTISIAQDLDTAKLNEYFRTLQRNNKMMGSVALARKGKISYTNAIGFSDIENKKAADVETSYGIGSISKIFTAAMVMQAVDENKIQLEDKLKDYFPQIPNADKISIRQLLQHTSGIPNFTDDSTYYYWYESPKTREEMIAFIAKSGSDFMPDSSWQYSNSNYVILSYILEDLYKTSFAEVLRKKVVKPLGLSRTYLYTGNSKVKNQSESYQRRAGWDKAGRTNSTITLGAGGIFSTPTDLVKFSYALFSGKLISESSLNEMTELKSNYGLGLFAVPFYHMKGYGHTGGVDGYHSVLTFFPHDSLSYAFISNGVNYAVNDVSIAVLSAAYGMDYHVPAIKQVELKKDELNKYIGEYRSAQIPLIIEVTVEDGTLMAQARGQSAFPLTAVEKDLFRFDAAGVEIQFNTAEHTLKLRQSGQEFLFLMQ